MLYLQNEHEHEGHGGHGKGGAQRHAPGSQRRISLIGFRMHDQNGGAGHGGADIDGGAHHLRGIEKIHQRQDKKRQNQQPEDAGQQQGAILDILKLQLAEPGAYDEHGHGSRDIAHHIQRFQDHGGQLDAGGKEDNAQDGGQEAGNGDDLFQAQGFFIKDQHPHAPDQHIENGHIHDPIDQIFFPQGGDQHGKAHKAGIGKHGHAGKNLAPVPLAAMKDQRADGAAKEHGKPPHPHHGDQLRHESGIGVQLAFGDDQAGGGKIDHQLIEPLNALIINDMGFGGQKAKEQKNKKNHDLADNGHGGNSSFQHKERMQIL